MTTYESVEELTEENRAAGIDVSYTQLQSGQYKGTFPANKHAHSTFIAETSSVAVTVRGQIADDTYFVLGGSDQVILNGHQCRNDEFVVYPPRSELFVTTRGPIEAPQVTLSREIVDKYFESTQHGAFDDQPSALRRIRMSPRSAHRFGSAIKRLAHTGSLLDADAQAVECLVFEWLGEPTSNVALDDSVQKRGRPSSDYRKIFSNAFSHIVENLQSRLDIVDLCIAAQTPARTLHRAFVTCSGVSPARFVLCCRLNAARAELLLGSVPHVSVSSVALKYRINHLGRFSSTYRQFFGEYPRTTLARTVEPRYWQAHPARKMH